MSSAPSSSSSRSLTVPVALSRSAPRTGASSANCWRGGGDTPELSDEEHRWDQEFHETVVDPALVEGDRVLARLTQGHVGRVVCSRAAERAHRPEIALAYAATDR